MRNIKDEIKDSVEQLRAEATTAVEHAVRTLSEFCREADVTIESISGDHDNLAVEFVKNISTNGVSRSEVRIIAGARFEC